MFAFGGVIKAHGGGVDDAGGGAPEPLFVRRAEGGVGARHFVGVDGAELDGRRGGVFFAVGCALGKAPPLPPPTAFGSGGGVMPRALAS